jgi:hypothetical protein
VKYRYHRKNSRKGYVHMMFDIFGEDVAADLGSKLGIKLTTLRAWLYRWSHKLDLKPSLRNKG